MTDFFMYTRNRIIAGGLALVVVLAAGAAFLLLHHSGSVVKTASPAEAAASASAAAEATKPADQAHPNATLPQVAPPAPGAVKPTTVSVSDGCTKAITPLRDLEKGAHAYVQLTPAERDTFNATLTSSQKICTSAEWSSFQNSELLPWMRTPPKA